VSIENALVTMNRELAKAEATVLALRGAIKALGGTVGQAAGKPARRRKGGGWPKGKPRGPKAAQQPSGDTQADTEGQSSPTSSPSTIAQARAKRSAPKPGASLAAAAS